MRGAVLLVVALLLGARRGGARRGRAAPAARGPRRRGALLAIPGIERTSAGFRQRLVDVANALDVDPNHLAASIAFESRFQPAARNPYTGATGLIQFMPSTARLLGTSTEALATMTAEQQLPYVQQYLQRQMRGPLTRLEDVYMAILAPRFVGAPTSAVLLRAPSKAYDQNRVLDRDGDGVITVGEATDGPRALLTAGIKRGPLGDLGDAAPPGPLGHGIAVGRPLDYHSEVTPEMSAWAFALQRDIAKLIGSTAGPRLFTGTTGKLVSVVARIEWHPPDPPIGPPRWHRGVGLYHEAGTS